MQIQTLTQTLKRKKPAIIRERGEPRFVVLDWDTYRTWEERLEGLEDVQRLQAALVDPKNQKHLPFSKVKKLLDLP